MFQLHSRIRLTITMAHCSHLAFVCVLFLEVTYLSYSASKSVSVHEINNSLTANQQVQDDEDPAVTKFREYLRIESVHPNPDYESCINWIRDQAEEIGLDVHLKRFDQPNSFALWLTWNGTNQNLKSILINSHMDVVAVVPERWTYPPFEAHKDENGTIYARGAQDMKSATVAQLEAIRRLKAQNFRPLRNVHLSILPDEEEGGRLGMMPFVNSSEFAALNVGFDIDEASTSPAGQLVVMHGEKTIWQYNFTITGVAAHGSTLPNNTAGEKLQVVIDRIMEFRASQVALLSQPNITMADVTSVNLVQIGGGNADNIIPGELWVSFDMRIRIKPGWNFTDIDSMLNSIVDEAGPGVSIKFIQKSLLSGETAADSTNIWWVQLQRACQQLNVECVPDILNGGTDGRYARNIGIPVLGINPFLHTERLAHVDNERINEREFLAGIDRYAVIIRNAASVSALDHP